MSGAILTGPEIKAMLLAEIIAIDPYDDERLNPNSYNVRLHRMLRVYTNKKQVWGMAGWHPAHRANPVLDVKEDNQSEEFEIPKEGYVLQPGILYLGRTIEHTTTKYPLVPMLEGRSSLGRLGLSIHITAGFGDVGYSGTWTLEMTCVHPLRIYPGIEIAQIYYVRTYGKEPEPYDGKYQNEVNPTSSKMHEEL